MSQERQRRGRLAEDAVAAWLALQGWRLVGRRMRVAGVELDLLAERGGILAVIEVKARSHVGLEPCRMVTPAQRRRLCLAARAMASRLRRDVVVRVDLAEIHWQRGVPRIRVHEDAFRAEDEFG